VLFTLDGARLYLFYHGKVYTIAMSQLLVARPGDRLPKRKNLSSKTFIWSLFDIRKQEEPELLLVTLPCLPVQTASPHPSRYHIWDKTHHPLHTGLPLWTRDELAQGFVLPVSCCCPHLIIRYAVRLQLFYIYNRIIRFILYMYMYMYRAWASR